MLANKYVLKKRTYALLSTNFPEFRFQFVGTVAAGATVDDFPVGVDDDGCRERRYVEAAGHAGGVAVELADVRPVHVEFLGELLQLRQIVHAALDGYADEIQLGVALVNIHEFGNDGDARLARRGAEAFVGCGRHGRVGKRCDADAALLTTEIDINELENQVVADDGELYFAQQILLYKLSCQFVVVEQR